MVIKTKTLSLSDTGIVTGILLLLILILFSLLSMPSLSLSTLKHWDRGAMLMLNGDEGAWMDQFWYAFSSFKTWIIAMAFIGITVWRTCTGTLRQKLLFLLCFLLLFVVLDQLSSGVIKPWVARLRPSHDPIISPLLHYVNGYHGGRYGFVSGHATNITGLVTWLCLIYKYKTARLCFILFGLALCFSRIYLGVHYPGDILCGALLGFTIARIAFYLLSPYFQFDPTYKPYTLLAVIAGTIICILVYTGLQIGPAGNAFLQALH